MSNVIDAIKQNQNIAEREKIIIQILILYNARSAEVLSAKWKDFYPGKRLILKGVKRSFDIIVTDRLLLEQIKFLPHLHPELIFYPTKYQRLYDIIKRQYSHIFLRFKSKKYFKVTHGFRYQNVEDLTDEDSIQAVLHHKSKKTQRYYKKGVIDVTKNSQVHKK